MNKKILGPALALALAGLPLGAQPPAEPKPSAAEHAQHGEILAQEGSDAHMAHQRGEKHGQEPGGHPAAIGMHHDFSDAERWTKVFDDPARAAWQKPQEVVTLMAIERGMQVADIGAGTGYFLGYLAAAVGEEGRVLGLDPEPNMVAHMTKKAEQAGWARVRAKTIPFDAPGLAAGSTDRILIVDTWHHIEIRVDYSKKLAAALADGGAVYVVDFTLESPVGPNASHRLAADQVMAELKEGGLEVELVEETLPNQYVVRGKKPGCDCGPARED